MAGKARASREERKPREDLSLQKIYLGEASGIVTRRLNDDMKRAALREG